MGKKKESKPLLVKSEKTSKSGEKQHEKSDHQQQRKQQQSQNKAEGKETTEPASTTKATTAAIRKGKSNIVSSIKRGPKSKISPVTTRPKLASLHETSVETDDMAGSKSTHFNKEMMSEGKCLEKNQLTPADSTAATHTGEVTAGVTSDESLDQVKSCPIYFGVRSYLHHFYETVNHPPTPGTEEDFLYLIHPKGRKCGALWFKIGLIIGATLFLLGAIAIVIGYAIPKQDAVVGRTDEFEIVDKDAVRFNKNLDICKLIGLAGFCSGGLVLVVSLLAPTFTSTYWEDDPATEPFRVSLSSSLIYEAEPKSPIPVTEKIKCIQPIWSE